MGIRYKVCQGGVVAITMAGAQQDRLFRPGEYLPDGVPQKAIESHIKSGYVVAVNQEGPPEQALLVENPPGQDLGPAVSAGGDINDKSKRDNLDKQVFTTVPERSSAGSPGNVMQTTSKKPAAPVTQVRSLWNLDPALLKSKTIDQLNVMVQERDNAVEPFSTTPEAVAFLSQDFVSPQRA